MKGPHDVISISLRKRSTYFELWSLQILKEYIELQQSLEWTVKTVIYSDIWNASTMFNGTVQQLVWTNIINEISK